MRISAGTALCSVLKGQDSYITAFNNLTYPQQVIAVLIEEDSMEHPHHITEQYLRTSPELHTIPITRSAHNATNTHSIAKEVTLGYIEEYIIIRAALDIPKY